MTSAMTLGCWIHLKHHPRPCVKVMMMKSWTMKSVMGWARSVGYLTLGPTFDGSNLTGLSPLITLDLHGCQHTWKAVSKMGFLTEMSRDLSTM